MLARPAQSLPPLPPPGPSPITIIITIPYHLSHIPSSIPLHHNLLPLRLDVLELGQVEGQRASAKGPDTPKTQSPPASRMQQIITSLAWHTRQAYGAGWWWGISGEVLVCQILECPLWPNRPVNHDKRLKAYLARHPGMTKEPEEIKKIRVAGQ